MRKFFAPCLLAALLAALSLPGPAGARCQSRCDTPLPSSITGAMIVDGTITAADLGTDSVGSDEIAVNAVTASEIASNAVDSDEIADGAVDSVHLTLTSLTWSDLAWAAEVDDGNSGAADTIDFTAGNYHLSTLTDNVTYTFTAPTGPAHVTVRMVQDVGGTNTVTWPATVYWTGGTEPTWVTTGDAVNLAFCYFDGTNYHCSGITGSAAP